MDIRNRKDHKDHHTDGEGAVACSKHEDEDERKDAATDKIEIMINPSYAGATAHREDTCDA